MKRNELYIKAARTNFEEVLNKKGYSYFTKGDYNLNIIGIRADCNRSVTNKYDDILVVTHNVGHKGYRYFFNITTDPGYYYMRKELLNPKGTAILVPGQYRGCWSIGLHNNKYKALVQTKPVKVYRDSNLDAYYDFDANTINEGIFGINIHRSAEQYTRTTINKYSAGCQVFNNPSDFDFFMRLCNEQKNRYGNSFTYTLINEEDLG